MKNKKDNFTTLCILLETIMIFISAIIILNGCTIEKIEEDNIQKKSVSFATWNAQTFFDSTTEGTEYKEFQSKKNWNEDKYLVRLKRICEVISAINADIIVLQEIENSGVMQDISNMMAGNSWNRKKVYNYGCFIKNKGDAVGCCIFSRFPVTTIKNHVLDIKTNKENQPPMRPVSQVIINIDGRELNVFINHWKSKAGGNKESELWRNWQEAVLCKSINRLFETGTNFCMAAGDFNKNVKEFICDNNGNIIIKDRFTNSDNITCKTPWLNGSCEYTTENGSYYYKENWERIDNILAFGNISISNFSTIDDGPWTDEKGIPLKYMYFNEKGYSDHLPLKCTITF